jgi:hypothetical protein
MKSSIKIKNCQVCNGGNLEEIVSLGHLPQVNIMQDIGSDLEEEVIFPAELLLCSQCSLVQLSHIVDQTIVFPPSYAYTSRTTKILRENFATLPKAVNEVLKLTKDDLVVDIGSNDGTLLSNFTSICRVLGVEPTDIAKYANEHGIPTIQSFFNDETAVNVIRLHGQAKLITATNVFAHIGEVHSIVDSIKLLMDDNGIFINESHYLIGLMETNQYDTIYHEHLRYYSLTSLKYLLEMHGLEVFNVEYIPTHGGSIRVYAANKGQFKINQSVADVLKHEKSVLTKENFQKFKKEVVKSKINLYSLISNTSGTIGAIGAPSRAATLVNYVGLNEDILDFVLEAPGSNKINKYMPGTKIPILEETSELINSVDNLLLLSWHIAEEIIPKLRAKGFKGKFITPLPSPWISVK